MKKIAALLFALLGATIAHAQPGPQPSPWTQNGSAILPLTASSCLTFPSSVTGGCQGAGSINASSVYINGTAVTAAGALSPTTTISGITNGYVLYNNAGNLGGLASSGSGNVARVNSPVFVTPNLGVPSAVTLTNGTGLPISTGVTGLGTGVATALGVNVGSAGAPVVFNGAGGTPSSIALANGTGLPISTGVSGLGTGVATALGVNVGSAGAPIVFNGAGGTPSSMTLTNATGLPLSTGVTGNLSVNNLNSGTGASSSTFWRGDGTWASPSFSLVVGSSAVSSGTSGYILYNNAGVLGNIATTGTGSAVLAASPALSGSPTAPTQSAADNSTKIATTQYVNSLIYQSGVTVQRLTSGTSATYTTPANVKSLHIKMVGAGGGGGGTNASNANSGGNDGGDTSFGTWTAKGGKGFPNSGPGAAGGTGGTNGTGTLIVRMDGNGGPPNLGGSVYGSVPGAPGPWGGAAIGIAGGGGSNAAANSGAGGGGAGTNATAGLNPGGGASGEYVEFIITSPSGTYTYTIGAGGTGGGGGLNGGTGGSGVVIVEERYQ